jgi:transcriptional regulator with XRE-family HTH domain
MPKTPRLREWRERATLSQEELKDRSSVSRATIADLEAGNRGAQPRTVRRLAAALGVDPSDLYGEPHSPKEKASPSQEKLFNNGVLEEKRRIAAYQRAFRDVITRRAERIATEADDKGYEPAWILEISQDLREIAQTLLDNGVLGNREAYPTEGEYRGSWEIADALTELELAVDRAWRAQMRVSERMERQREAAAKLDSIWQRNKEADKSSKEALQAIRQERSESA